MTDTLTSATVITEPSGDIYHHLPDYSHYPAIDGLTVRQALHQWRGVDWSSIGGTHEVQLTDGTTIAVELQSSGNGQLMSSQQAVRREYDRGHSRIIRRYAL